MSIKCQICGEEFSAVIHWKHLAKHNVTTSQYRQLYGDKSLCTEQHRKNRSANTKGKNNPNYGNKWDAQAKTALSKKLKGKSAWNKGLTANDYAQEHRSNIQKGIDNRERKYCNGEMSRHTPVHSNSTKSKISESVKQYFQENPQQALEAAKKAVETKRRNGYDFGQTMRGKTHSEDTKQKISQASRRTNRIRRIQAQERITQRAQHANIHIENPQDWYLRVSCTQCGHNWNVTKQYFHTSKFHSEMCPVCYPRITSSGRSQGEQEVFEYVSQIYQGPMISNHRSVIAPKELDIYLNQEKIAIEFNGVYWHSELLLSSVGQDAKKDFHKYNLCKDKQIRLIQIYDTEWKTKQHIVKNRLNNIINSSRLQKLAGRKCKVVTLQPKTANQFLQQHHIKGRGRANIHLGLVHHEQNLVSVMTFSKNNISRKQSHWEIDRYAVSPNTTVIGGAEKLFSYFYKTQNPECVVSFSDNRWDTGAIYQRLGFEKTHTGTPNYWYFLPNDEKLYHRYSLRKNKQDDPNLTEWENRIQQGWNRVWDSGHIKWVFTKKPQ